MVYCMRFLAQVICGWTWFIGWVFSFIAKMSPIIDDSISLIAGIVGLFGGVIWVFILLTNKKKAKVELEIKELELKKLKAELDGC